MKLAEALMLRADAQKRLEQLKIRLLNNAKVQEGDSPAEKPASLLEEAERVAVDLLNLIQRINQTNTSTQLEAGETIADAIARRDVLRLRQSLYRDLSAASMAVQQRFSRSEVKFVSTIDIAEVQKQADTLARECRELDARIQSVNWQIDLQE
ncbi:MAG: DIP1984 family protein [Caldilineaceae bacterium]